MNAIEARVVDCLRDYDPERIIVFGSWARGEADSDSDLDLLVIKDDPRRWVERVRDVRARLRQTPSHNACPELPAFDVLVFTPEEVRQRLALGDDFFEDMLGQGRTIYERLGHERLGHERLGHAG